MRFFIFSIAFIFIYGCKEPRILTPDSSISQSKIISFIEKNLVDSDIENIKLVVVIPNAGCNGCVGSTQSFVIDKMVEGDLKDSVVIWTDINDFKRLKLLLGSHNKILNHPNVIIDKQNEFKNMGFVSFYPEVIFFTQGEIKSRTFLKPENPEVYSLMSKHLGY